MRKFPLFLAVLALVPAFAFAQTGATGTLPSVNRQVVTPELRLNSNGTILVRGMQVTALEPSVIRATFMYGSFQMPMVIQTTAGTMFWDRAGLNRISLSDISVGDTLSFSGVVRMQGNNPTVMALVVRDWSPSTGINQRQGTGTGNIGGTTTGTSGTEVPSGMATSTSETATSGVSTSSNGTTNVGGGISY
jgi:hypothetical protein